MASVSTYLNFAGNTEEAFRFYAEVFGTEIVGIYRIGDIPPMEGMPAPAEEHKNLIMNIALPITGGHILMGTDAIEGMGGPIHGGNDVHICIDPDTRAEADRIFAELSAGGDVEMPIGEQFWGDYYAAFTDKFGKHWMINCTAKE